jgi:hypothetical protein
MKRWRASAAGIALIICAGGAPALAQMDADKHAEALTRASCQAGKQSDTVKSANAALERDPDDLGPRIRLADALVDQGCYQEAVSILEAAQASHPHSGELAGKLRDVRSLVTEQTYIEGLTQAAEGAKFQRNQLRCTRLADITACDDALKFKPDDAQLLTARADALAAQRSAASAAPPPAAVANAAAGGPSGGGLSASAGGLNAGARGPSGNGSNSGGLNGGTAGTGGASTGAATAAAAHSKATKRTAVANAEARASKVGEAAPVTSVAALEPQATRSYSNEAPPGQTN